MNQVKSHEITDLVPEQTLQEYILLRDPIQKQYVCQYWLRGTCCFPDHICHNAHGSNDLIYSIENSELRPLFGEEITKVKKIIKLKRIYYVVHDYQHNEMVQQQLKWYYEFLGKQYTKEYFDYETLQQNKKVRGLILTFMLVQDISNFYNRILKSLGVVSKALFVNELNRVGYSFLGERQKFIDSLFSGSQQMKPGTIINHLISYGVCFPRAVGNTQAIPVQQQPQVVIQQAVQTQVDQTDPTDDPEDGEDDQADQVDDEETIGVAETYLMPIHNINELQQRYVSVIKQIMNEQSEYIKTISDIDDFMLFIDNETDKYNQTIQLSNILPTLNYLLKLSDMSWDEFKDKFDIPYTFKNGGESGVSIPHLMKGFNEGQKAELRKYLELPKLRFFLCQYWLRGMCIFKRSNCQFAHGLEDLDINFNNKVDVDQFVEFQKPLKYDQKPLISHRSYRVLYMYQREMLKRNLLERAKFRTQFEIDNIKEYRDIIRSEMRRDLIVQLFIKMSNKKPILKSVAMNYFEQLGMFQPGVDMNPVKLLKILINDKIAYERVIEQQVEGQQKTMISYLVQQCNYQEIEQYYIQLFIDILVKEIITKDTQLPIDKAEYKKHIGKYDQDIRMPGLYKFLRNEQQIYENYQDFLKLRVLPQLKQLLAGRIDEALFNQILDDGSNVFTLDLDKQAIEEYIKQYTKTFNNNKQKVMVRLDKVQAGLEQQLSKLGQNCTLTGNNKTFFQDALLQNEDNVIVNLYGIGMYLVSKVGNTQQKVKRCKCGKQLQTPNAVPGSDEKLKPLIAAAQEFIDPNVRNTIIIDNEIKLMIAADILKNVQTVAVDCEGRLVKGDLWLVQLGIMADDERLILIFDLMWAKYIQYDPTLHAQMLSVLQITLEDESIRKVFHDCKRDSQALHLNGICPRNVVDTSVTYCLLQYFQINANWKHKNKHTQKKINASILLRDISQQQTPSINVVLSKFGATHGANELKEEMHEKFHQPNGNDFFVRPNPAFMYYSARDVEDLTQVYLNMETELLKSINNRSIIDKLSNKNRKTLIIEDKE